jgi:hypothetical protein
MAGAALGGLAVSMDRPSDGPQPPADLAGAALARVRAVLEVVAVPLPPVAPRCRGAGSVRPWRALRLASRRFQRIGQGCAAALPWACPFVLGGVTHAPVAGCTWCECAARV